MELVSLDVGHDCTHWLGIDETGDKCQFFGELANFGLVQ